MKQKIAVLGFVGMLLVISIAIVKNSDRTEHCMNHEHAETTITKNGDKAVVAPEEIHHGMPMIYLCL